MQTESIDLSNIPEPKSRDFDTAWYAYVAGVGGMGVNTISAIIAVAGAKQGYTVRFTNKKGLAIRNGGVYSHISFTKDERVISQLTPYGHADLLLGLDILEAVRGLDPNGTGRVGSPQRTTAVVETGKRETILSMIGRDDFDTDHLEDMLRRYTNADTYFGMDLGEISERYLGNKIYANSILPGRGDFNGPRLPLTLENIRWAMKQNIKSMNSKANSKAFEMGRKAALDPDAFLKPKLVTTYSGLIDDKAEILAKTRGNKLAETYRTFSETVANWSLSDATKLQFALGVYDLIQWGGVEYAQSYVVRVKRFYDRDNIQYQYRAPYCGALSRPRDGLQRTKLYRCHH